METARPLVGGRYEITATIAHGGMATIHRARDRQLDRDVAIKRLRAEYGADPAFAARFSGEARRTASLEHPNVVSVTDFGNDAEGHYLVMEVVEGTDLAALIRLEAPIAPERAASIGVQIAAALDAAHQRGIVHRDIKPGNVLVAADDVVKVTDFGIARAMAETSVTATGVTLGSVHYFSPEQARGEEATPASDVYALGIVLYELLTGKRPFSGESPAAVALSRLAVTPQPPSQLEAGVPTELDAIVMRALARDAAERWPSAHALRAALIEWRAGAAPARVTGVTGVTGMTGVTGVAPPSSDAAQAPPRPVTEPFISPGAAAAARPSASRRRLPGSWLLMAALLVLLAAAGFVATRVLPGTTPSGPLVGGAVTGSGPKGVGMVAPDESTPTPTPSASPTPTPIASPTPAATPPASSATPTAAPPVTSAPPVVAAEPADAVTGFYAAVERQAFDEAYALWSERMRAEFPRQDNLDGRWDQTTDVTINRLDLLSRSASTAVVGIAFTETFSNGSQQTLDGSWELVRVDGRWLLDRPFF